MTKGEENIISPGVALMFNTRFPVSLKVCVLGNRLLLECSNHVKTFKVFCKIELHVIITDTITCDHVDALGKNSSWIWRITDARYLLNASPKQWFVLQHVYGCSLTELFKIQPETKVSLKNHINTIPHFKLNYYNYQPYI